MVVVEVVSGDLLLMWFSRGKLGEIFSTFTGN